VKRTIFTLAVLALALAGGAAAYQAVAQRNYGALLTRGDAALRDDQAFNAIEAYSGAIALRPDSMLAYLRRGQTYQRRGDRGDLDAAARDFRTAAVRPRPARSRRSATSCSSCSSTPAPRRPTNAASGSTIAPRASPTSWRWRAIATATWPARSRR
jgi:hypothetical protein